MVGHTGEFVGDTPKDSKAQPSNGNDAEPLTVAHVNVSPKKVKKESPHKNWNECRQEKRKVSALSVDEWNGDG